MKPRLILLCFIALLFNSVQAQLIQGTIKPSSTGSQVEIWLKPGFSNTTQYLAQIGLPVAFPASVSPQPTGLTVTLDPAFIASFGNNYTVTVNPVSTNTGNTEKYFNIVLIRSSTGASVAQTWTAGTEIKVLTATFSYAGPSADFQAKLADYQDGGSDGQSFFYTADGNGNYYISANSVTNFYTSSSSSTGGDAVAGYAQVNSGCIAPATPVITNITSTGADVNWAVVAGATGYEYAIDANASAPAAGTATTSTSFSPGGLNSCTQYYVHVRTNCGAGNFSAWTTNPFTTISIPPVVSPITGGTSVCAGFSLQLNNSTPAGIWSSDSPVVATVSTTGLVTGLTAGLATISYAVTNSCGTTTTVTAPINVNTVPAVTPITGNTTITSGATSQLADAIAGGVWSSNNTGVATIDINGLITGIANGTATISYTVTNSCGTSVVTSLITVGTTAAQLIQGTIKRGATTGQVEVWLKPNFSNTTQYLFQIGLPVSFPVSANPQPSGAPAVTIDPSFTTVFGNNYIFIVNPVASNASNTEKYFNIILTRTGTGGSLPQTWTAGTEYKVITLTFAPSNAPSTPVKLADYQDGGSDGQGYFYSADGNANYYMTGNSVDNFYASAGNSTTGGDAAAGYAITSSVIGCDAPIVPAITGTTTVCAGSNTQLANTTTGGAWSSDNTSIATVDVNGLITGVNAGTAVVSYTVSNSCGPTTVTATITVNTLPSVAPITGNTIITTGGSSQLSSTTAGGVWTSNNTSVATVDGNGLVNGLTTGTAVITYTVTNSCGPKSVTTSVTVGGVTTRLIQGTIKPGAAANEIEFWIKPNFNNSTEYLAQVGLPVAFPASASPQPTGLSVNALDPAFISTFGNYNIVVNPVATNTGGSEKYFNIVLSRTNVSTPQVWTAGTEYKVLTASFAPSTAPNTQIKLADYQDGGSDGQGYFYSADGNANYYMVSNSAANFYASPSQSVTGGDTNAGYAQTINIIPAACAAPSGLSANNITIVSADINWNTVNGSAGYEYVVSTGNVQPAGAGIAVSANSIPLTGLIPATPYYIFVRTNCGNSFSSWTSVSFTTQAISCTAPSGLATNNISSTSADISWTPVSGAAGYEYVYSTTNAIPAGSGTATTAVTVPLSGLQPGNTYYVFVRINCGSGFSSWSNLSFSTPCSIPSIPVATNLTPTSVQINWTDIPDVEGYQYVFTTSATLPSTGIVNTIFAGFPQNSLIPGTQYYVYVRTNCSPGVYSDWVSMNFTAPYPPCNAPVSLTVSITGNTADIAWSVINGAQGYEYVITTSSVAPGSGTFTTSTTYHTTGLSANTQYYVYVRTSCGSGQFSVWVFRPFTTGCFVPSAFLVGNDIAVGTADLAWSKITGAVKYEYVILNNAAPPGGGKLFTNDTVVHLTGLLPGAKYYLHVRSYCSTTAVSEWNTLTFYTSGISVYPNPTSNKVVITIYGNDVQNQGLRLFDVSGKLLRIITVTGNRAELDLSRFTAGIYVLKYRNDTDYQVRILKW